MRLIIYTLFMIFFIFRELGACPIIGPEIVCNASQDIIFNTTSNGVLKWTIAGNGAIDGIDNGQNVKIDAGTSGTFTLTLEIDLVPSCSLTVDILQSIQFGLLETGDQTLCNPGDPSNITFSTPPSGGNNTFDYQWYYRDDVTNPCPTGSSISGWIVIPGATTNSYDPPSGLTMSRTYACLVDPTGNPDCGAGTWAAGCRKITILPAVNYGTLTIGDQTLCNPGDPSNITFSTPPSGGNNTFDYQWYYRDDVTNPCPTGSSISGWIMITGATTNSYDPPSGLTISRTYACLVDPTGNPDCGTGTWAAGCRKITIIPAVNYGTLTIGDQILCNPGDPSNITFSTPPSGGNNTFNYQWYYRDDVTNPCPTGSSISGWIMITGATTNSYDPPSGLTISRTYACLVDPTGNPDCGTGTWAAGCRKITIIPAVNYGTLTIGDQTLCNPGDPSNITFSTPPSGGNNTFDYQWYYRDDVTNPCPTGSSISGWIVIPGATTNSYDPPSGLTMSRTYACLVDPTGNPDCGTGTWAAVCRKITIIPVVNYGTLTIGDQTLCNPGDPSNITFSTPPSGGNNTFNYQWYYRDDVTNPCPTGSSISGWIMITGATTNSYDPPSGLTISRTYACLVDPTGNPDCGTGTWAAGCRKITIIPAVNYGTLTIGDQTLCNPGDPSNITFSTPPSGGNNTFDYQWYYRDDVTNPCPTGSSISGWIVIPGATTNSYDPPSGLTMSRTYSCLIDPTGSPDCGPGTWAAGCRKITIIPAVNYGTLTIGNQTLCNPGDPSNITFSTPPSGGNNTFDYQWYYKDDVTNPCPTGSSMNGWIMIPGATTNTYDPPSGLTISRTYACLVDPTGNPDCGTGTWAAGCRKIDIKTIPDIAKDLKVTPSELCLGSKITLEGNCNGNKIIWKDINNNDVSSSFTPSNEGKFLFYAYCEKEGCLSPRSNPIPIDVYNNPMPGQISPQNPKVCDGKSIQLNINGNSKTGSWIIRQQNSSSSISSSGLFSSNKPGISEIIYQVEDLHGSLRCTAISAPINIAIDENPTADIIGDKDVCIGKDAKLQVEVKTGALPFKFLWNTKVTSNGININSVSESKTYLVTVTDNNTCSVVSTYNLNALDTPKIVFNLSTPINNTQVIQIEDKSIPNNSIKSFELKVKNVVTKVEKIISNFDPSGKYNFANLAYGTYEVCLKIINNSMCEGYYCKNYLLQDTACYGIVQASLDRVIPKYCIGDIVKIKLHIDFNKFDFSRKFPVCQVFNNVNLIYSKEFSATIKDFDTTILIPVDQANSFNLVSSISGLDFSGISISCSDAKNFVVNNKPSLLLEDSIFCSKLDGIENIKIRFKINDDKGNISKTDPFSYEFNGSSKKVKDNDTFSIDQTFKNDTLHIMRCIDLTNITNNTTTCSIDPLPECIIINKIPIFNLKDSSFCSGTKVNINLKDFTFDTTNIIFSWRAADSSFKNIKQIVIDKVKEGSQSFFYKISNINDVNCYSEAKIDFDGLKSPEIRDLESLLNCSGLIKLNLKIGEISKLDSVIWSSNHPNTTELIPTISRDIVLVKSKSAQENIECIIKIGSCKDTMSINLSNFPVVDTSSNLIKSIICNDSTLLYTNLSKCYSWYYIDPEGKIRILIDTTPYIVFNSKILDSSNFFISTYDCNTKACDTTALFHRSSSNEEHCQDFLHPNVKLYPNPNSGSFTLIVDEFPPGLYMLKVFDLLGRELYQSESVLNSKNAKLDYQLESNLASGMYFVSFGNGSGIRFTIPILITK